MAKVDAVCPHCQEKVHVYTEWAGESATCPYCRKRFTITFPELPSGGDRENKADDSSVICPACQTRQDLLERQGTQFCASCGQPFLTLKSAAFRTAVILPEGENGACRVACPYCGAHYQLNYIPHMGLVGCQNCMKIFASTAPPAAGETEEVSSSAITVAEEMSIPVGIMLSEKTDWGTKFAPAAASTTMPRSIADTVPDMDGFEP